MRDVHPAVTVVGVRLADMVGRLISGLGHAPGMGGDRKETGRVRSGQGWEAGRVGQARDGQQRENGRVGWQAGGEGSSE